ncbi:MAG TPA: hypothetical protein VK363_02255 [Pyrinomonadaceae bacterium]|nr:hypothetical protein [Pyrinomonadaceae bacterium]
MRKRRKVLGLAFGLTVLALGLVAYNLGHILAYICDGKEELAEVKLKNELVVKISAQKCWENARPIYYEVRDGSEVAVPTTYISSGEPEFLDGLKLKVLSNGDGTVYGVVEERLPQKVWLLYSVTGGTWPRCEDSGLDVCEERGEALLKELQRGHPEITLTF